MANDNKKQRKQYFYKFNTSTALGKQFRSFWNKCQKATLVADKFAAKVGAATFYPNMQKVAGGVDAVSFPDSVKPNEKIWRSIGKDEDGLELWVPDVKQRRGVYQMPDGGKCPSHTANRIYGKPNDKGEVRYVELYRDDEIPADPTHPRRKTPQYVSQSIRIEKERLLLPTVSTAELLRVLGADVAANVPDDDRMHIVQIVTPEMFEWGGAYYLCIDYPCNKADMEEIGAAMYQRMNNERIQTERAVAEMNEMEKGS